MVEAIGFAASIAGLVQLTGSVFKQLTKFSKEDKDAPSKAQDFSTQTRNLTGILENLRLLTSVLGERDSNPALKLQHLECEISGNEKTVLYKLIIKDILEQSDNLTAVCFAICDYKNPDSCLPQNILAALAVQLGLQGEEAFDLLEEYFDMLHPDDKLPTKPRLDDLVKLVGCMSQKSAGAKYPRALKRRILISIKTYFILWHPFHKFAAYASLERQRSTTSYPNHLKVIEEDPALGLLKRLFDIHEADNFRACAHAVLSGGLSTMHQLSNGPLQLAVFLPSLKLCQCLIDIAVDVKVVRGNFTPLAMTIALEGEGSLDQKMKDPRVMEQMTRTINVLLDNDADTAFVIEGHSYMAHVIDSLPGHYLLQFIRPTSAMPEDAVTAFSNFECKDKSDDIVLEAILHRVVGEEACSQWKQLAPAALSFSRGRGLSFPQITLNPTTYSLYQTCKLKRILRGSIAFAAFV
ncbi:hypothetical protein FBULB1_12935 [Fusarium bulbicola]|nr:hypothetical protein FBULB1_12935 [Fusarium bulbicola]